MCHLQASLDMSPYNALTILTSHSSPCLGLSSPATNQTFPSHGALLCVLVFTYIAYNDANIVDCSNQECQSETGVAAAHNA